jgi:hypothetical protein
MRFFPRVGDCEQIPSGFGVAWYRERVAVCAPLGLNLIIGWARKAWITVATCIRPDILERSYEAGVTAGREIQRGVIAQRISSAFEAGRLVGQRDGRRMVLAEMAEALRYDHKRNTLETVQKGD